MLGEFVRFCVRGFLEAVVYSDDLLTLAEGGQMLLPMEMMLEFGSKMAFQRPYVWKVIGAWGAVLIWIHPLMSSASGCVEKRWGLAGVGSSGAWPGRVDFCLSSSMCALLPSCHELGTSSPCQTPLLYCSCLGASRPGPETMSQNQPLLL